MSLIVDISDRADASLDDIAAYIELKTGFPRRAARFVAKLADKARSLGPVAPTLRVFYVSPLTDYRYRQITHRGYRIVYTIQAERVIVVDFFHGARTLGSLKRSLRGFTA